MSELVSVIVPVYKVEKYIGKCIESIINQTYSNLEIILVDDGSPDKCGDICDMYALKDKRIKTIHKANGGLSDARNAGLEAVTGDYVGFVDSDDYIEPEMFEILVGLMRDGVDLSICGFYDDYHNKIIPHYKKNEKIIVDPCRALEICLKGKMFGVIMCNKLFKKEFFEYIRFPKGKNTEDVYVIEDLIKQSKKVSINTKPLYHYVHREGSITTESFNSNCLNVIYAYEQMLPKIKKDFPSLETLAKDRILWAYMNVLDRSIFSNEYELNEKIQIYVRKNLKRYMKSSFFTIPRKLTVISAAISLNVYKYIVRKFR